MENKLKVDNKIINYMKVEGEDIPKNLIVFPFFNQDGNFFVID